MYDIEQEDITRNVLSQHESLLLKYHKACINCCMKNNSETVGDRIRQAREILASKLGLRISQAAFAKICKWEDGQTRISNYENGIRQPATAEITTIARASGVRAEWLQFGSGKKVQEEPGVYETQSLKPGPKVQRKVPLISWVQAGEWQDIVDNFHAGEADEWRETTAKVGKHAFALRVVGNSMANPFGSPSIPEGSVVIIDPDAIANSGSIVVARLDDTAEATLKKLVIDGPNKYLMPLNPDYRPIQINDNCTIVGVAVKVEFDL